MRAPRAVRQAVDQWFPRYMPELYQVDLKSIRFQVSGVFDPIRSFGWIPNFGLRLGYFL